MKQGKIPILLPISLRPYLNKTALSAACKASSHPIATSKTPGPVSV